MAVPQRNHPFVRRWLRRLVPASVVIIVVGFLGAGLYHAVEKARNAARSAATT
jgi:hypothetical protein